MNFAQHKHSKAQHLRFYKALLRPRMIEEKMLLLLRQGKISKWFSGIGQEAINVGATMALENDEYIFPMHRNLGVFTTRQVPLERLFAQFQGKALGFTSGRDRSFHFGTKAHHIIGMISHLGPQLALADGIGMGHKLDQEQKVCLAFTGDGGTSEGDFHEALNLAAVWQLPVIFMIENNGYALSTPTEEQYRCKSFVDKGIGYGIEAHAVDGNNVLDVYDLINTKAKEIRKNPHPVIIEALTFRMRGHEEASGTKYVPKALFEQWGKKDPLSNYEAFLLGEKILTTKSIENFRDEIKSEINDGLAIAFGQPVPSPQLNKEINDVYAPHNTSAVVKASGESKDMRLIDAISDGLRLALEKYPQLVMMGQDIAEYGGVFKISDGFTELFGRQRIRNTPICESAIVGIGLGYAIKGGKAIVEMQFADFVTMAFNQIVNNLAKSHYRWGQKADVVIRMPCGGNVGAGPFHSQSNEAWFFHTPGLKVVYPSNPEDAKGLLLAAIADPNPVLFFEHKALYRSLSGSVHEGYYETEIGKAQITRAGTDLSIITYGAAVHWAVDALENSDIHGEVVDLRTLLPWDKEAVRASVRKTNKVLVLHEDTMTGGVGAEIAAWISEHCFESLDAPVLRVAALDTPIPFAKSLEAQFLPIDRLGEKLRELMEY